MLSVREVGEVMPDVLSSVVSMLTIFPVLHSIVEKVWVGFRMII
jgi:hypothetical protein